jgi:hypothetical protein
MMKPLLKIKDMHSLHVFYVLLVVSLATTHSSWGQAPDSAQRKIRYSLLLGGGVSQFYMQEFPSSPKYRTAEFLIGIRAYKPIGRMFSIVAGLSLGAKFKREPYFKFDPVGGYFYTSEPQALSGLDDTTSKANAYYLSLPILLNVTIGSDTNIFGGISGRQWLPRDSDYMDVLRSQKDFGFLVGTSRKINPFLSAGLELFYGIKDIYPGAVSFNGSRFIDPTVTNQSLMIFLTAVLPSRE